MIKARDTKICEYCGAKGPHSICIAKPPYPVIPFSALEELYAGNAVTKPKPNNVTRVTKPKVGRPKRYETAAEKQKAYRERKRNG